MGDVDRRIDHEKLKTLAAGRQLTGRKLARTLGVTPQAAGCWLRGTSQPRIERLVPLAVVLGTTVDDLFTEAVRK